MDTKKCVKILNDSEALIRHGIDAGFLTREMTIQDLLNYFENIRHKYLPTMEHMIELVNEMEKR